MRLFSILGLAVHTKFAFMHQVEIVLFLEIQNMVEDKIRAEDIFLRYQKNLLKYINYSSAMHYTQKRLHFSIPF